MTTVRVHLDTAAGTVPVGTARVTRLRGVDTTEFTYDDAFLAGPAWEISPDLPLSQAGGVVEGLPGALADAAPDSWGRNLIARRRAAQARDAGHPAPALGDVDYLLGVADRTRQGALRFRVGDGPFLAEGTDVPRQLDLGSLLAAATRVAERQDATEAVDELLAAGSGSLGGARPKVSVAEGTRLHVAKFPQLDDRWDVMRWEAVALDLAAACGLRTPPHRLVEIDRVAVLLVERFDRHDERRVPYLSARSLIGDRAGPPPDYLELVEALTDHGSDVTADLAELWARLAFSVAINNTDDHMKNHGLLRAAGGWTLSPVFDVNPDPRPTAERASGIGGATAPEACVEALLQLAGKFRLTADEATRRWRTIVTTCARWREVAARHGLDDDARDEFAGVLDRWAPSS